MMFNKILYLRIFLISSLFISLAFSQSIVTQEAYDSRFTPPKIGLPENMPFVKSLICE